MKHRNSIIMLFIIMVAFGCKPDPLEYARPDNLAGTIYPQLESMGIFENYLKALNQTSYPEPLDKGGSWTIFAPNDKAFEQFMSDEGYASFEDIPAERILKIVQSSIIIDGWNTTTLTYYRSQFYEGQSFRRHTQYVDPIIEVDADDYGILFVDPDPGKYLLDTSSNRKKTTTYFLDSYFDTKTATKQTDYDFMFPGKNFTVGDMKVFESNVEQTNVIAENGIIYVLDKVLEPRKNLYQNLSSEEYGGKYSTFKTLLERFAYLRKRGNEENSETGEIEEIYELRFNTGIVNNLLPFSPDDENHPKLINNVDRTYADGTGLLVPTNEALQAYLDDNTLLGQFYDSYDDMSLDVLGKFLAPFFMANFWDVCPTNFGQTFDINKNAVNYSENDIVDKMYCSNGFFVGVNTIYENNSFVSSMGPLLLNPDYSIMLKAVQDLKIDNALQSPGIDFSIFGIKNNQFIDISDPNSATRKITVVDFNFDEDTPMIQILVSGDPVAANNRLYPENLLKPEAVDVIYVTNTLKAIVLNQIVEQDVDFNSSNYYQTKSGEFIYASGGDKIAGGGDIELGRDIQVEKFEQTNNGKFYEMSSFIERPERFTYGTLLNNVDSKFSMFLDVLQAANQVIDIPGVTEDKFIRFIISTKTYSLLAPNNDAVNQAIADGVIVNPDPAYLAGLDELELAIAVRDFTNFAKKHFLQQAIPTDGTTVGTFPSLYYSAEVNFKLIYDEFIVTNNYASSSLTVTNIETGEAVTTSGIANLLSRNVVIHELTNYIK